MAWQCATVEMSMSKQKKTAGGVTSSPPHHAAAGRRLWRVAVPILLAVAVIVVFASKPSREPAQPLAPTSSAPRPSPTSQGTVATSTGVPRLVDVGADKCIPCKAMAPILAELRVEYTGRMLVDFIDVWKNPGAGDPYNIYAIPTQIFYDGNGNELTRHEGFISKQDILATWKRFGIELGSASVSPPRS
jgi:thioredoxin 1